MAEVKAGPATWVQGRPRLSPYLEDIRTGALIKLDNGAEQFWAQVSLIDATESNPTRWLITAKVVSGLLGDHGYDSGDLIQLEGRHVHQVYLA
jgi:hypothetical protein